MEMRTAKKKERKKESLVKNQPTLKTSRVGSERSRHSCNLTAGPAVSETHLLQSDSMDSDLNMSGLLLESSVVESDSKSATGAMKT